MTVDKDDIIQVILDILVEWNPVRSQRFSDSLYDMRAELYGPEEGNFLIPDPDKYLEYEDWEINSSYAYKAEKVINNFCREGVTVEDLEGGRIRGKELWKDGIRAFIVCLLNMYMSLRDAEDFVGNKQFKTELFDELANLIEDNEEY